MKRQIHASCEYLHRPLIFEFMSLLGHGRNSESLLNLTWKKMNLKWKIIWKVFFFYNFLFSVRLLSVLRGHSFFSSPPQRPMTSDFKGFLSQILSITLFSYLNSWERAIIPFSMLSAKQGNHWYHFYNVFGMTWSLTGDWNRDLPPPKPALYH
mgnify:CR=1 FL=1